MVAESARGSDIMLEAVLEAEVAHNAKKYFAQAEKEIPALKGEAKRSLFYSSLSRGLKPLQL